jgi:hypothetical protein
MQHTISQYLNWNKQFQVGPQSKKTQAFNKSLKTAKDKTISANDLTKTAMAQHPHFCDQAIDPKAKYKALELTHDPKYPGIHAPRVAEVKAHEKWRYQWIRTFRWILRQCVYLPLAAYEYLRHKPIRKIEDQEFAKIFSDTLCSKFLSTELTATDRQFFAECLESESADTIFYKADYSLMNYAAPNEGLYAEPSISLFKQVGESELIPIAIKLNELCLRPQDGHAWDLAKVFVMQANTYMTVLGEHPLVHFPMDPMNVCTLKLPKSHIIRQLLEPHMAYQIRINEAVRFSSKSVKGPNQTRTYTPFFGDPANLIMATYSGQKDQESFEPYEFKMEPKEPPFAYGKYLKSYFDTIYEFVKKVVEHVDKSDPLIQNWADEIAKWTPGFPGGEEIIQGDNLEKCLTVFIYDVAVEHSADHEVYSRIPLDILPCRIRIAPPESSTIPAFDYSKIRNRWDAFQHRLGWAMYFKPSNITLLKDTKYPFQLPELKQLNAEFLRALKQTDKRMREVAPNFPRLYKLARSIQY